MKEYNSKSKMSDIMTKEKNLDILKKYQVPCISCPFAPIEMNVLEIGQIAKIYGIKLNPLLKELNGNSKKTKK